MRVEYAMVVLAAGLVSSLDLGKSKQHHQLGAQRGHVAASSADREVSLRSALDAVTRKQRSLDQQSLDPAYFAAESAPTSFRSYDQGAQQQQSQQRKLHRQQVTSEGIGGADDELAFIPLDGAGQQETIGDGFQHLSNKQLNRALLDYLYSTDQAQDEAQAQSVFRERANGPASHKRSSNTVGRRLTEEDLDRIFSSLGYQDDPEDPRQLEEDDYERALGPFYNDFSRQSEKVPLSDLQTLYRQILEDEALEQLIKERQQAEYPRLMDRRNVNSRYPIFNGGYRFHQDTSKRFPVAKRSTKAAIKKRMIPDPKASPGLASALSAHSPEHQHPHGDTPDSPHDHDHANHDHAHGKDEARVNHAHNHTEHEAIDKATSKEVALKASNEKSLKDHSIGVSKKSIDWSNYFGIDRRRKKSVYLGRPDTQDQDDEYLLARYYETMAQNLNPRSSSGRDGSRKRDEMQQVDSRLKNMKNLMIDEALQIGSQQDVDNQDVKDDILSRLAIAYQTQKLRQALNELRAEAAASKHQQGQLRDAQSNQTQLGMSGGVDDSQHSFETSARSEKRSRNDVDDTLDDEENKFDYTCPQLSLIERRCKASEALIGDFKEALQGPCVIFHICDTCGQSGCLERFAMEAEWICREGDVENSPRARKHCMQSAMQLTRLPPALASAALCFDGEVEACLGRHIAKYRGYFPGSSSIEKR